MMIDMLKLTTLWIKNMKEASVVPIMFGITLFSCFLPSIPSFFIFYGFLIIVLIESSMSVRIPYRFILPVSIKSALHARLIVSILFFIIQLALYMIASIIRGEQFLSDLAIIVFTVLNCLSLFISFFYTKKRMAISTIIIGAFCGIFANIFVIFVLSGGNLGLGLGYALLISILIWSVMYFIAKKLAYKQYV